MDGGGGQFPGVRREQFGHRMRVRRRAVGRDDGDLFAVTVERLPQFVEIGGFGNDDAGATVFEKEAVVGSFVRRIDRDRNRAGAHRAEERRRERRSVAEYEEDSIFTSDAERPQRARRCAGAIEEVVIRDPLVAEIDRRLFAATGFEIVVNQCGRIVLFRYHRFLL
jgi:hypothetical protein